MSTKLPAWRRVTAYLRWYWVHLVDQFTQNNCLSSAAALTYTTLFAVVPVMTVTYTVLSWLPEFDGTGARIEDFLFDNLLPMNAEVVRSKLHEFSDRARNLSGIGFAFVVVTAFMMLMTIEKTLNNIWGVTESRAGLHRFLLYWAVLTLAPTLLVGGLMMSVYLFSLPLVSGLGALSAAQPLWLAIPFAARVVGFAVIYFAVPNCRVLFRHALLGGLIAAGALELGQRLFAYGIRNSNVEPVYGTFAAVPLFLASVYLVWVIVLSGAILVRSMSLAKERVRGDKEPPLIQCARVLQVLYDAHQEGESVSDQDLQARARLSSQDREQVFKTLHTLKLLNQTEDEAWILGRSLKSVTLWDLYQRLPDDIDRRRLSDVVDLEHITEPLLTLVDFGSNRMSMSLDSVFAAR